MAQTGNEITEKLFEAVDTIIGERISSLPYDQTIVAQIISAEDHANGIYIVTHDYNTEFTAYADYTGFQVGDRVYVRIPEGDYTKQKVITGKYLEGLITSSETHNILTSGDANYYVYDKNNLIHSYNWSKEEHEIVFTYFNSIDSTKTWKNVLNTYTGGLMKAERPKAIKININGIIVYLHKYREDPNNGNSLEFFAAEQEGVTLPTFIPDVEQGDRFFSIKPNLTWNLILDEEFNPNLKYYTRTGTNTNNYVYTYMEGLTEFEPNTNYYVYVDINLPTDLVFYKKNEQNEYIKIEDLTLWDKQSNLYYHSTGELELVIPETLPMLQYLSIYYNQGIHIKYKIAPEYKTSNSTVFINVQFCPIDETYNVSNSATINFGYLTELEKEINPVFQLIRHENDEQDIVQAIINNDTATYSLKILLIDKNGNYVDSNKFKYKWDYYLDSGSLNSNIGINNSINLYPERIAQNNKLCYKVDLYLPEENGEDLPKLYKTYYYPIAFTSSSSYYATTPTIITYNQAGVEPNYFNSLIQLNSYSSNTVLNDYNIILEGNTATIDKNVLIAYNYLNKTELDAIKIIKNNQTLWYQTILFIKEKQSQNTISREDIGFSNYQIKTEGALTAQTNEVTGFVFSKGDSSIELNGYNKNVNTEDPVFHLSSDGTLKIGYTDFTMTGHITEGATYIEDSNKTKYTVGDSKTPIYFSNGVPVAMSQLIDNENKIIPVYITSHIVTPGGNTLTINNNTYNGRFIKCNNNITITLNNISNGIGFECEIYNNTSDDTHKITFSSANNNIKLYCIDKPEGATTLEMTEPRGVTVIKYIANNHWLLAGSVEESS